jgi:tRNA(Arg) A34 adenosine deaminase TadA
MKSFFGSLFVWYDTSMALPIEKQEELVLRAMELAAQTTENGNLPFAGILADETGVIVLEASNTVNSTNNAAAHAEINQQPPPKEVV